MKHMGALLGDVLAGYRDRDNERCADALVNVIKKLQNLEDLENSQHDMLTKIYGLTSGLEPAEAVDRIRDEVGTFLYGATLKP